MNDTVIDCHFPGGNIVCEGKSGDTILLAADQRDTAPDWFYWCFRARCGGDGARNRRVTFQFAKSPAFAVRGPAYSEDGGRTWRWLGKEHVDGNSFWFDMPAECSKSSSDSDLGSEVRFSMGMPYQLSHWDNFLATQPETERLRRNVLCTTRQGREVFYYELGGAPEAAALAGEGRDRFVFTCRHHCCEAMASYVLEGIVQRLLGSDMSELLKRTAFLFIPFVDADGVEAGDQGKWRQPHDHNRDYGNLDGDGNGDAKEASIYPETRAIRELILRWRSAGPGQGTLSAFDLHCPYLTYPGNEALYLVGSPDPAIAAEQALFSEIVQRTAASGPLPFDPQDNVPYGQSWNTAANYRAGLSFTGWIQQQPRVRITASVEIPYADARGAEVNQQTARLFGHSMVKAIAEYVGAAALTP